MTTETKVRNLKAKKVMLVLAAALGLTAIAGIAIPPGPAMAHASYESSTPGDGEVVAEPPDTVEVFFSQEMRRTDEFPDVFIVNEAGDTVSTETTLSDEDRTLVTIDMPPALPEGRYTVIWHTLSSEDGEEASGAFHYYVGEGPSNGAGDGNDDGTPPPDGEETPAPTQPPETSADSNGEDGGDDGVPVWGLILGIIGAAVVAGGAGIVVGRSSGG